MNRRVLVAQFDGAKGEAATRVVAPINYPNDYPNNDAMLLPRPNIPLSPAVDDPVDAR